MRLYSEFASWYRLVDPLGDHEDEAAAYASAFERVLGPRPATLLELGSGAGHNAFYLKRRFRCTLADISPEMLALSQELNPDCDHVRGDMRSVRLERTFDAVFVHDAAMYLTTEDDLAAAIGTAYAHTAPGGTALFAPDFVKEALREMTEVIEGQHGDRAMRCLAWTWDPDPTDSTYLVDYTYLLRQGREVTAVHDRHLEGVFPRATWTRLLSDAGYRVELVRRPLGDGVTDEVFLCRT